MTSKTVMANAARVLVGLAWIALMLHNFGFWKKPESEMLWVFLALIGFGMLALAIIIGAASYMHLGALKSLALLATVILAFMSPVLALLVVALGLTALVVVRALRKVQPITPPAAPAWACSVCVAAGVPLQPKGDNSLQLCREHYGAVLIGQLAAMPRVNVPELMQALGERLAKTHLASQIAAEEEQFLADPRAKTSPEMES